MQSLGCQLTNISENKQDIRNIKRDRRGTSLEKTKKADILF